MSMTTSRHGWWAVVETLPGSGLPDNLYGPYYDRGEAEGAARGFALSPHRRANQFTVAFITPLYEGEDDES